MTENWAYLLERPEIQFDRDLLARAFAGRRVVITGAAGSVGSALSRLARQLSPEKLVLVDSHEASLVRLGRDIDLADGLGQPRYVLADVRDRRKMSQVLRRYRAEVVFHLAAYKQVPLGESNVDQVLDVNILGSMNVVECARDAGVSTVVYPSTDKAVSPSSLYGASKRIVEQYFRAAQCLDKPLQLRLIRLVNVFGTQGSVVENFASWIQQDRPLRITDPSMDRYWMTMAEATHLLAAASIQKRIEGIHLLDVGKPVPLLRTAERLYQHLRPGTAGPRIEIIGSRPGERLHEYLAYPNEALVPTDVSGLLIARLSAPAVPATEWLSELETLRERLFDLDPAILRSWAFDVALASVPWQARTMLRQASATSES